VFAAEDVINLHGIIMCESPSTQIKKHKKKKRKKNMNNSKKDYMHAERLHCSPP
jgi:hypothetical protein